ncbi:MAG: hypothetical protein IT287_01625, partial [Bdellovibrionaceae bacterium]|nr:hypothetical protein [Pseudobdellovibrionaceae bacterium]
MSKSNFNLETVLKNRGPELTAYALGELSDKQRAALQEEFKNNPEVLAYMQEMAQLSGLLAETVPKKSNHSLTQEQKVAVLDARPTEPQKSIKNILSFFKPQLFMPAFGAVAIALLVFVLLPKTQNPHGDGLVDISAEPPASDYYKFEEEKNNQVAFDNDEDLSADRESLSESAADSAPTVSRYYGIKGSGISKKSSQYFGGGKTSAAHS